MKSKVIIVQIIFLIILGCKSQNINQEKGVPKHLLNWIDGINTHDSNTIKNLYDSKSVKIISPDNFIENSSKIANLYRKDFYAKKLKDLENFKTQNKKIVNKRSYGVILE